MIIDVHGHIGPWFFAMGTDDDASAVAVLKRHGITLAVVSASLGVVYDFREGNRELAGVLDRQPDLYGYVTLNPHYLDACLDELETWDRAAGFVGVKLHPAYTRTQVTGAPMDALWDLLGERGLPVLLHTWGEEVALLPDVLERHPTLRIIAAHMGGPRWDLAVRVAAATPRLYLEPCCSLTDRGKLEAAVERVPTEQLLFGTDASLIDPSVSLGMLQDAVPDPALRRQICWDNAVALFGLDGPRHPGERP